MRPLLKANTYVFLTNIGQSRFVDLVDDRFGIIHFSFHLMYDI